MMRLTNKNNFNPRAHFNAWDGLGLLIVLAVISLLTWNAKQMATPYQLGQPTPISLDIAMLPFYATRTVTRMLIAMFFSLLFTFIFGTLAAKSKRAERIIIPLIDILQSVPILGYLSVVSVFFIARFPGSMMGPECATIFVLFTSQAWNMALGFYQTVRGVPSEVIEAARIFHLSAWQRFWRIDVPHSMPTLLWNMMASMSAGWFFVVASEAITVSNQSILLPGVGSYIATAIQAADSYAISFAVLAMFIVIIVYDQLLFRPLIAWSEKFKGDLTAQTSEINKESWVIDLFRRTQFMRAIGRKITILFDAFVNIQWALSKNVNHSVKRRDARSDILMNILWYCFLTLTLLVSGYYVLQFIVYQITIYEITHVFFLGSITAFRVAILMVLASLLWVPIGIRIGLSPRLAHIVQPIAQILSAFPANLFYPFIVMLIVQYQLDRNIWLTPLMILGSQWYILFNVIAGASSIPKDLMQVMDNLGVHGFLRWRTLLLPSIFPFYVTGAITAAGGAWNASIVAEIATWGHERVVATGLGAYITEWTTRGDFTRIALGVGTMCCIVLVINRLLWRPLYTYALNRFTLES